jgi:sulfoxide reductase heme-binding subunit YedZ
MIDAAGTSAVWYLMRGSGIVSLLLLTGVMALGVATLGGVRLGSMPRFATLALHRSISLLAVVFLTVHVASAVVDPYAAVGVADAFLPFAAAAKPLAVGLGALALDLVLALAVTGALRRHIGQRAWRAIHWAAYAAWPAAFLHALAIGSDGGTLWMRAVAVASVAVVGAAAAWRALLAPAGPGIPSRPAR